MLEKILDINNINDLEHEFSKNFGSPIFPVLADYYLKNKELKRSRKVCELGLKNDPMNTDGKFILAKVNLYENKLKNGEQLLKKVVDENLIHVNGLRILIEVMKYLKRSPITIKRYTLRLLDILPEDKDALIFLDYLKTLEKKLIPIKTVKTVKLNKPQKLNHKNKNQDYQVISPKEIPIFEVGMNMATFTMVEVLKNQKHYKQALAVLSRLEEKSSDLKRIKKEREVLELLLSEE